MTAWTLIPCLAKLRTEFSTIAPIRFTGADGSIGDTAHAAGGTSDHLPDEDFPALRNKDSDHKNEVHALDITTDLNESDLTMEKCVQHILSYCRRQSTDPLNEARLRYIIFNRRIWKAPSWRQETYTGTADPHTGHAHFSAEYDSQLEADTSTWHLEEIPVALTAADKAWIVDAIKNNNPAAALAVWTKARTSAEFLSDTEKKELVDSTSDATIVKLTATQKP